MPSDAVRQATIADLEDLLSGLPECPHKGIRVLLISLHARRDPQGRYSLCRDMEDRLDAFADSLATFGLLVALKSRLVTRTNHQEILTAAYLRVFEGTRDNLRSPIFLEGLAAEVRKMKPILGFIQTDSQGRFRLADLTRAEKWLFAPAPG